MITSRENETVKLFAKLSGSKKQRDASGLFCLEGVRLIADAVRSGVTLEKILITENCLQKYNHELAEMLAINGKMNTISGELAGKLSDVKSPQGVFAIAKKLDKTLDTDTIKSGGCYLALCSTQDPGNIGTMIRTADALGIDGVLLHNTCDIYSPKVVRSTMGSLFRMRFALCPDLLGLTASLNACGVDTCAAVVEDALPVTRASFSGPRVLYIGNEGNGLPDSIASACARRITIPMRGNAESLNAASAAAILMWEMTKE